MSIPRWQINNLLNASIRISRDARNFILLREIKHARKLRVKRQAGGTPQIFKNRELVYHLVLLHLQKRNNSFCGLTYPKVTKLITLNHSSPRKVFGKNGNGKPRRKF